VGRVERDRVEAGGEAGGVGSGLGGEGVERVEGGAEGLRRVSVACLVGCRCLIVERSRSGLGALALVHGESGGGVKRGGGRHAAFLLVGFVGFESLVFDVEVEEHQFLLRSFVQDEVLPDGCRFVGSVWLFVGRRVVVARHGSRRGSYEWVTAFAACFVLAKVVP